MRADIHPKYQPTTIACACGEKATIRSTGAMLKVEICSKCHPLFTGKWKLVDTAGRIEKFHRKYAKKAVAEGAAGPSAAPAAPL